MEIRDALLTCAFVVHICQKVFFLIKGIILSRGSCCHSPNAGFRMTRFKLSTAWTCGLATWVFVVHIIPKAGLKNVSGRRYGTANVGIFIIIVDFINV